MSIFLHFSGPGLVALWSSAQSRHGAGGAAALPRHPLLPPHRRGAAAGGLAGRGRRGGASWGAGVAVRTGQGGARNLVR